MATLLLTCQKCGYKQYYLQYSEGARKTIQRVFAERPDLMPCPKCKNISQKLGEVPFKDIIRLHNKFPLKKVIRSMKSTDDLINLPDEMAWIKSSEPDEPVCPKCGKGLCFCGDPEEPHCSDSRCGWIDKVNSEFQI